MAALPIFQTDSKDMSLLQTNWSAQLNPLLANPLVAGLALKQVSLSVGATVINHRLGRLQQGWFVTDVDGAATIYRSAPLNSTTLTLTSDAAVTVNLWVF